MTTAKTLKRLFGKRALEYFFALKVLHVNQAKRSWQQGGEGGWE